MALEKLRDEINSIDREILKLLGERREVARRVVELKKKGDMPLRDSQREEALLAELIAKGRELGLDSHFVTRVFHEIIDDSIRSQQIILQRGLNREDGPPETVAFQGIDGAYSHLAAKKFFAPTVDPIAFAGYSTFAEVVEAVEEGAAQYGLLPVENTTAGLVNEVYDLLLRTKLSLVGEEIFHVQHCLLALEGLSVSRIRRVLSHPQALAQCTRFLSQLKDCQKDYYTDTAMAVQKVKDDGDPTQAAIASEEAGRLYGLKVLVKDLADHHENFTRFVVIHKKPVRVDPRIPTKTSLIMATAHQPGALNNALGILTRHGINMTSLHSRPKPGSSFQYLFYLDIEGNLEEKRVKDAVQGLRGVISFLKILGSYPMEKRGKTPPTIQSLLKQPATSDEAKGAAQEASAPASPGTEDVETGPAPPLTRREAKVDNTIIRVRDVEIGGEDFVVVAGPASVESEEQMRKCARHVKECGGKLLRAGCFRPRMSPSGFEGLGLPGLEILSRVGREYDLPIVTEVASRNDVETVARVADCLQVGARNMQDYGLLQELGRVNRPVILKRGMMASLEEFLNAAEHILEEGNHQVILCERGIRTFETVTRNTLDLGAIPILKRLSHLPIIVDPTQAAGQRDLVVPLALAAKAVGPHGMMVEIHPDPAAALADGPQALRFDDFAELMREIYRD